MRYPRPPSLAAPRGVVIRRTYEEGQRLPLPHYSLILISRDDLPLADLVGRHRAKPGPQSACKGPPR